MRPWFLIVGFFGLPGIALAQVTDYSAGKSPAQLFSSDCSACHQSARGLAKGRDQRSLAGFLREHYTTKQETAAALAGFLAGAPAGPAAETRNPGERRQPATPAARVQRPPAAVDQPPADETSIAAPEGGAQPRGRTPATREAAKPPAAAPAPAAARGKKPDPKADAKPEPAETARAAEEAEKEALRAKVRGYATAGEEARPKAAAAPAATDTSAAPSEPAKPDEQGKSGPERTDAPAEPVPLGEGRSPPG